MAQRISEQVVEWLTAGGDSFTPQTTVPLHVKGRTILGTTSALNNNTDWNANHTTINGHMVINGSYNTANSYSEGLRINRSTNGHAMLALGGEQGSVSGTGKAVWYVGAKSTPADATTVSANITDSIFVISLNSAALGAATPSLRINNSGTTVGKGLGIANTTKTTGYGLSLYNGAINGIPSYGIFFGGTSTFGSLGNVAMEYPGRTNPTPTIKDDWATYFTMNTNDDRGWIFEKVDGTTYTPVVGINNNGSINTAVPTSSYLEGLRGIKTALNLTAAAGHHTIFRTKSTNGAFILAQYNSGIGIEYGSNDTINGSTNTVDRGVQLMNEVGESRFNKIKIQTTTAISGGQITWPDGKTTANSTKFGLWTNQLQTWLSAPASTTSNMSSQLIISSVDAATGNGGNVALELWRGDNASWQFSNESGTLHIKNNYTTAKQTTYSQDSITVAYNTGVTTFNGTTDSTAVSNGTVIVNGGVGIAKQLHVGTRIQIHATDAQKHIEFTRAGWNYIALPDNASAVLAIGFGTNGDNANQKLVIEQGNVIRPGSTNTESLGTSSKAWAQIYGNGLHANVANSNSAGGLSLYGTNPASYGVAMRAGAAHGWITAKQTDANIARAQGISTEDANGTDWAINFYNSGSKLRGFKFMHGGSPIASINGYGYAQFNRIGLNRSAEIANGRIYWYNPAYYTWVDYMSDITDGTAPTGGKPSSISNVTTWAKRSLIEQIDGYGWIWESSTNAVATASTTAVTPIMSLSSYNGRLTLTGDIWHKTSTRTGAAISFKEGDVNGTGIFIGNGGLVGIGGGESPQYLTNDTYRNRIASSNNGTEELWNIADGQIRFITNAQNLSVSDTTWNGYAQTYSTSNRFYEAILDSKINFYPWKSLYGSLGTSSYYWRSAYIYGAGAIQEASLYWGGVGNSVYDSPDATISHTNLDRGITAFKYTSFVEGNRLFGLPPQAVTIEYTTDSGSNWFVTSDAWYSDDRKRNLFNFQETQIPVGNLPKFDYGSGNTAPTAVGMGVRITADLTKENRTFYLSALETYWRCYCCTCTCTISLYNAQNDAWRTIRTDTITNSDTRRYVHLGANYYSDGGRVNRDWNQFNKIAWTIIVTAVGTSNVRYVPSIGLCHAYGINGGNLSGGSFTPSGGTAQVNPNSSRFAWSMMKYNSPIYVANFTSGNGLGAARIGTQDVYIGDDLRYSAANTEKWSNLIIGNGSNINTENAHSQGRLRLYSAATNYHDLVGNSTTVAYTHTLPNASGTIIQCIPAVDGDTDYQASIIYNQNKTNYPTSYGSGIVLPYRKPDLNTKSDYANQIYIPTGDTGTYGNTPFFRTSIANEWNAWQMFAHAPAKAAVGSGTKPVYIDQAGLINACTYNLNATINAGTANHIAYYSGTNTIDDDANLSRSANGLLFENNSATEIRYRLKNTKGDMYFLVGSNGNRGFYENAVDSNSAGWMLQWPNGSKNAFFPSGNLGVNTTTNSFTPSGNTSAAVYNFLVDGTAMITGNLNTNGAFHLYAVFNTSNASDSVDVLQLRINGQKWCNFNVFRDSSNLGCGIFQLGNAITSTSNGGGARGTLRLYGPGESYYQFNNMYAGSGSFTISLDADKILQFPCNARLQKLLAVGGDTSISTTTWSASSPPTVSCGTKDPVGTPATGKGTVYFRVV